MVEADVTRARRWCMDRLFVGGVDRSKEVIPFWNRMPSVPYKAKAQSRRHIPK
jgi:hypothetical protein